MDTRVRTAPPLYPIPRKLLSSFLEVPPLIIAKLAKPTQFFQEFSSILLNFDRHLETIG